MLDNFKYRPNTTDENIINEILNKQAYRKKKINFFIEEDDIWLDGGAHIGFFSLYASKNNAKKIYCFEPEEENFSLLTQNIEMMRRKYNTEYEIFSSAVNQKGGQNIMTIAPNTWRHSLVSHYKKKLPTVSISCIALDDILNTYKDINCIKLDIEGSELEILKEEHDFSRIKKMVFEYSFTKDRNMQTFFQCVKKLEKYFNVDIQKSYHNQKFQGKQGFWGGFIDSIIFCKAKNI
tara:strand:+ start:264 stop:968 length:705 start_codon:yes stop_codon:yes gene_type:complete